jgi:hypothetical protein
MPDAQESLHWPLEQTLPTSQRFEQPPQCAGLAAGSTHSSPHSTYGGLQVMRHVPSTQLVVLPARGVQALAQAPQFAASAVASTHVAPHGMNPRWHTKEHSPSTHTAVAFAGGVHVASQPPQCRALPASSTHSPPHVVCPALQPTAGAGPMSPSRTQMRSALQ